MEILKVTDLHVSVEDKEILHGLNLTVNAGETHVLMGPNGAGKSTFGNALMGNPAYEVTDGSALFGGEELLDMPVNKRAQSGLFMSFQNPIEVPGISLENFIRTALEQRGGKRVRLWDFRKEMKATLQSLQMDEGYASRDLNVGFSGGEKKKAEIVQLLMLKPSLAILDETDSGLDVDAVRTVSRGVEEFQKNKDAALIIITHNTGILSSLKVDKVHVLVEGKIVAEGGADLIDEINRDGFARFEEERANG
ncbi:MAG: Fe-S cluster assembly ATPase SufC [Oscillospiraceae bacterium]|nr:Fe-S cluster assembly ATPase SufC [Oscillospiraceae bacterium]